MKRVIKNKKGLALIATVMLIVFVSIAVLGLTTFIVQWFKQLDAQERQSRCVYNAMSGVNYAIYRYRVDATLASGPFDVGGDANNNFTLSTTSSGGGGAAANLVINATASSRGGSGNKDILGVTLTNTSLTSSIILDQMVMYVSNSSESLDQIRINNVTVRNSKDTIDTTSRTLDLTTNVTIPANTTITINYIRFTNSFDPTSLYLGFIMTDLSTTSICTAYPAQPSTCTTPGASLTIQSMGKTSGSNQYRSVQATYDTATGNVSDYDEIAQTVP